MVWKLGKGFYEKVMMKQGGPALDTDKNFISNWFLVCKLGYSRKRRWELRTYFFVKITGISRFVISPLEIWASSLEILQNYMTLLENKTKFFVIFSLLSWKILVISYSAPGSSAFYFFNIPGKSKSWNS